tara:strand:+ start:1081 stop:2283 length:1203 start_codon:yes stop_codon:yes gene_type:complete
MYLGLGQDKMELRKIKVMNKKRIGGGMNRKGSAVWYLVGGVLAFFVLIFMLSGGVGKISILFDSLGNFIFTPGTSNKPIEGVSILRYDIKEDRVNYFTGKRWVDFEKQGSVRLGDKIIEYSKLKRDFSTDYWYDSSRRQELDLGRIVKVGGDTISDVEIVRFDNRVFDGKVGELEDTHGNVQGKYMIIPSGENIFSEQFYAVTYDDEFYLKGLNRYDYEIIGSVENNELHTRTTGIDGDLNRVLETDIKNLDDTRIEGTGSVRKINFPSGNPTNYILRREGTFRDGDIMKVYFVGPNTGNERYTDIFWELDYNRLTSKTLVEIREPYTLKSKNDMTDGEKRILDGIVEWREEILNELVSIRFGDAAQNGDEDRVELCVEKHDERYLIVDLEKDAVDGGTC